MATHSNDRRQFVQLASSLLALPAYAMSGGRAHAQAGKPPLRLITICDHYGLPTATRKEVWMKKTTGDFALTDADLGTVPFELRDYKANMLIPTGMNLTSNVASGGGNHTHDKVNAQCLTGSANLSSAADEGPGIKVRHSSVDVHIGARLNAGTARPFPHLFFSDKAQPDRGTFCFDNNGSQIRAICGVQNIANRVFTPTASNSAGQVQIESGAQSAVLDLVARKVQTLQGELQNANKAQIMDAYKGSVEQLARELRVRASAGSGNCGIPAALRSIGNDANNPQSLPGIFSLIYHTMACNLASSITYSIGAEWISFVKHTFLPFDDNGVRGYLNNNAHSPTHDNNAAAYKAMELVYLFHAREIKVLLDRLKATPEADGSTMLDNTVVFWTTALANNVHAAIDYPHLIIAGKNTNLRGGYHYEAGASSNSELMATLCRGVGLQDQTFGGHNRQGVYLASLNRGPIAKMLKA